MYRKEQMAETDALQRASLHQYVALTNNEPSLLVVCCVQQRASNNVELTFSHAVSEIQLLASPLASCYTNISLAYEFLMFFFFLFSPHRVGLSAFYSKYKRYFWNLDKNTVLLQKRKKNRSPDCQLFLGCVPWGFFFKLSSSHQQFLDCHV